MQLFETAEVVKAVTDGKETKGITTVIESSKNLTTEQKTILKTYAENSSEKSLSLIVKENSDNNTTTATLKQNEPTTAMVDVQTKQYANIDHLDDKTMQNQMKILAEYGKEIHGTDAPISVDFFQKVKDDQNILPEIKERFLDTMTNWNAKLEQEK